MSRPENCVGGKFGGSRRKKGRKRRKALKRRLHSHPSNRSSDKGEKFPSLPVDRPFTNPTFQGSIILSNSVSVDYNYFLLSILVQCECFV